MREEMKLEIEMRLAEYVKVRSAVCQSSDCADRSAQLLYREIDIRERKMKLLEAEIANLKSGR